MATEQERAQAHRAQQQAREETRLARERDLAGSRAALKALETKWSALRRWEGWDPDRRVDGEPK